MQNNFTVVSFDLGYSWHCDKQKPRWQSAKGGSCVSAVTSCFFLNPCPQRFYLIASINPANVGNIFLFENLVVVLMLERNNKAKGNTTFFMLRLDSTLHQCFAMARSRRYAGARKQHLSQWDVKGFPPSSPPADHNCHVSNAKSWANANAATGCHRMPQDVTGCHRYLVLFSPDSSRLCLSQSPTHNSPCGAGTTPLDRQVTRTSRFFYVFLIRYNIT